MSEIKTLKQLQAYCKDWEQEFEEVTIYNTVINEIIKSIEKIKGNQITFDDFLTWVEYISTAVKGKELKMYVDGNNKPQFYFYRFNSTNNQPIKMDNLKNKIREYNKESDYPKVKDKSKILDYYDSEDYRLYVKVSPTTEYTHLANPDIKAQLLLDWYNNGALYVEELSSDD